MTQPEPSAALLISVWSHEGTLVGRVRGFRGIDQPQGDPSIVAGDAAILDAVRDWLASIDRAEPSGPHRMT
jgi:hypothetical protein